LGSLRSPRGWRRLEPLREKENAGQNPPRTGRDGPRSTRKGTQSFKPETGDRAPRTFDGSLSHKLTSACHGKGRPRRSKASPKSDLHAVAETLHSSKTPSAAGRYPRNPFERRLAPTGQCLTSACALRFELPKATSNKTHLRFKRSIRFLLKSGPRLKSQRAPEEESIDRRGLRENNHEGET